MLQLKRPDRLNSLVGEDVIEEMIGLARSTPQGCFVEVGVYRGGTAQYLYELALEQQRLLYLYDTFTGIPHSAPDKGDSHKIGDFADTSEEAIRAAFPWCQVVAGVFPESAVHMPSVAFAHLDCDQYKSVLDSLHYLAPKMVKDGVIWLDDCCLQGALTAANEFCPGGLTTTRTNKHFIRF